MTDQNQVFGHWKKNIAMFLAGQSISLFGSMLVDFAIVWYITLETGSGLMLTISTLCSFLPRLVVSLFAGVWADRYHRKALIMLSDAMIAFCTLVLAIVFMAGYRELWVLFAVAVIRSFGGGIQEPSVNAAIPQLVPEENLTRINGLRGTSQGFIQIMAPLASAGLMSITTLDKIFFIDVFTAALAVTIMFFIRLRPHKKALEKQAVSYFKDLKEGMHYVLHNKFTKELFGLYSLFFLAMSPVAFLTTLYIKRSFGEELWRLSANEVVFGAGMILGGVVMAAWGGFKNRVNTMSLSLLIFGAGIVFMGITPFFFIYLTMMFFLGTSVPFFSSPAMTLFQENVEQDMQGRVFGLMGLISTAVLPLGMVIFGPMSDHINIVYLFLATGVVIALLGVFLYFNKTLREFGKARNAVSDKT